MVGVSCSSERLSLSFGKAEERRKPVQMNMTRLQQLSCPGRYQRIRQRSSSHSRHQVCSLHQLRSTRPFHIRHHCSPLAARRRTIHTTNDSPGPHTTDEFQFPGTRLVMLGEHSILLQLSCTPLLRSQLQLDEVRLLLRHVGPLCSYRFADSRVHLSHLQQRS